MITENKFKLNVGDTFFSGESAIYTVIGQDSVKFLGKNSNVLILKHVGNKQTYKGEYKNVPEAGDHVGMVRGNWLLFLD